MHSTRSQFSSKEIIVVHKIIDNNVLRRGLYPLHINNSQEDLKFLNRTKTSNELLFKILPLAKRKTTGLLKILTTKVEEEPNLYSFTNCFKNKPKN